MRQNFKIFIVVVLGGMLGGIMGVFLTNSLMSLIYGSGEIKILCQEGEEIKKSGVICKFLEVKDRGGILKVSEIVSPPGENEPKPKDKISSGKFIEIKFKIKNERKEPIHVNLVLMDKEGRRYEMAEGTWFWIKEDLQFPGNINPGLSSTFVQIFEVPKEAQDFKIKALIWKD